MAEVEKNAGPFKALLLDADGVLEDVVELASGAPLTDRHVDLRPFGGDCDRQPGRYRWDRERQTLVPVNLAIGAPARGGVTLEQAFAALLEANPQLKHSAPTMLWLAEFRRSVDGSRRGKQ